MGVYIPNMSKPKICYMCPLSDETWFCPIVGEAIPRANRKLENCPLIEIDLEKDMPTIWYNRQTGQFEPKGTKQEVYKRIYKLQNGGRGSDEK